ncbi:MAG: type IV pilus twitching motility protein PilT [Deltaproteobacteria bacterium]
MNISDILRIMCSRDGSDLFLKVGNVPYLRLYGELVPLPDFPALTADDLKTFTKSITDEKHRQIFDQEMDTDFAMDIEGLDRFRVSVFYQRGVPSMVMRRIKKNVPDFTTLNLPEEVLKHLSQERRGLVLLAGQAGHGKSTTIASMVEYMNQNVSRHVLTVEDPIEFTFTDKKSIVNQRELGIDVASYPAALKQITLQSPDVVFIGTIRDLETMTAALMAAEMGILVLSTVHTVNAAQTVQRLINFFPPHQHNEIRMQFSFLLKGVISIRLVPRCDIAGRIPALEIMTLTPTISRLIREGAAADVTRYLEEGDLYGMCSFKQSLAALVKDGKVTAEEAYKYADSREDLELEIKGIKRLQR